MSSDYAGWWDGYLMWVSVEFTVEDDLVWAVRTKSRKPCHWLVWPTGAGIQKAKAPARMCYGKPKTVTRDFNVQLSKQVILTVAIQPARSDCCGEYLALEWWKSGKRIFHCLSLLGAMDFRWKWCKIISQVFTLLFSWCSRFFSLSFFLSQFFFRVVFVSGFFLYFCQLFSFSFKAIVDPDNGKFIRFYYG